MAKGETLLGQLKAAVATNGRLNAALLERAGKAADGRDKAMRKLITAAIRTSNDKAWWTAFLGQFEDAKALLP